MWTDTRPQHARKGPGLPSDLTDAEWALVEPSLLPALILGWRCRGGQSGGRSASSRQSDGEPRVAAEEQKSVHWEKP